MSEPSSSLPEFSPKCQAFHLCRDHSFLLLIGANRSHIFRKAWDNIMFTPKRPYYNPTTASSLRIAMNNQRLMVYDSSFSLSKDVPREQVLFIYISYPINHSGQGQGTILYREKNRTIFTQNLSMHTHPF